jgi:hypothetical protein
MRKPPADRAWFKVRHRSNQPNRDFSGWKFECGQSDDISPPLHPQVFFVPIRARPAQSLTNQNNE